MATRAIDPIHTGTDHRIEFLGVTNRAGTVAVDVSSWALSWMMKRSLDAPDVDAAIVKTTAAGGIVVSGAFDANPAQNAQVITVIVRDTDTDTVTPATYAHELKRMDDGFEAVLSRGEVPIIQSVHRQ